MRRQAQLRAELGLPDLADPGRDRQLPGERRLYDGGGSTSSSSSSSSQTTNQTDRRQTVDSNSVGVSSDTSTVTVNVLDAGAVKGALELAAASDQNTQQSVASVLGFAKDVFTSGLAVLDKAGQQIQAQTSLVATAYDNAKGEGTQKNLVAAAALAAVVIVAVKVMGK